MYCVIVYIQTLVASPGDIKSDFCQSTAQAISCGTFSVKALHRHALESPIIVDLKQTDVTLLALELTSPYAFHSFNKKKSS